MSQGTFTALSIVSCASQKATSSSVRPSAGWRSPRGSGSFFVPTAKADLAAGLGRWLEELAEGGEDLFEVGVVGGDAALEGRELFGENGVGAGEVAQADEGSDDEDAHLHRARA